MNKLKEIMEAIFISIFAGIIVWIIQEHYSFSVLIVVKIIVLIILFILLAYLIKLYLKLKSLGIINVLDSQVKGEGSTKVFMNKTNHELCFVGIAATKWLDETDTFEKTIRRICGINQERYVFCY